MGVFAREGTKIVSFLVRAFARLGPFVWRLVWGGNFSWQKHEWCGSWSVKNQKGGFMGINVLAGKWCGISLQSSTPVISVQWVGRRKSSSRLE